MINLFSFHLTKMVLNYLFKMLSATPAQTTGKKEELKRTIEYYIQQMDQQQKQRLISFLSGSIFQEQPGRKTLKQLVDRLRFQKDYQKTLQFIQKGQETDSHVDNIFDKDPKQILHQYFSDALTTKQLSSLASSSVKLSKRHNPLQNKQQLRLDPETPKGILRKLGQTKRVKTLVIHQTPSIETLLGNPDDFFSRIRKLSICYYQYENPNELTETITRIINQIPHLTHLNIIFLLMETSLDVYRRLFTTILNRHSATLTHLYTYFEEVVKGKRNKINLALSFYQLISSLPNLTYLGIELPNYNDLVATFDLLFNTTHNLKHLCLYNAEFEPAYVLLIQNIIAKNPQLETLGLHFLRFTRKEQPGFENELLSFCRFLSTTSIRKLIIYVGSDRFMYLTFLRFLLMDNPTPNLKVIRLMYSDSGRTTDDIPNIEMFRNYLENRNIRLETTKVKGDLFMNLGEQLN